MAFEEHGSVVCWPNLIVGAVRAALYNFGAILGEFLFEKIGLEEIALLLRCEARFELDWVNKHLAEGALGRDLGLRLTENVPEIVRDAVDTDEVLVLARDGLLLLLSV